MIDTVLEAFRFRRNGQYDIDRIVITGGLLGAFVLWRLIGAGSHGAPEVMRIIEQDIVEDFRQQQRKATSPDTFNPEISEEVAVRFSNVSMTAPVTSWEINEDVGVRFDYELIMAGTTQQRELKRYVLVSRKGSGVVFDSGPLAYYAHLLF